MSLGYEVLDLDASVAQTSKGGHIGRFEGTHNRVGLHELALPNEPS